MQADSVATEKTHIRCKIIIELLGKPKEHIEKSIKAYVDKIKNDSELILLKTEFSEAKEKENLWAAFAELEMVVKGIRTLIAFCFDYMPSSIQVLKPEQYNLNKFLIEDFTNDLMARLHQVDMIVKKEKNENEFLKKNMNTIIKNTILIPLSFRNLNRSQLAKITGIHDKELEIFLETLVNENKIKEENGSFTLMDQEVKNA